MLIMGIIFFCLWLIWTFLVLNEKCLDLDHNFYKKIKIKEPRIKFYKYFTNLADTKFFMIICLLLLIFLKNKKLALGIIILMLFNALIIFIMKRLVKRERPNERRLVEEKGYSYPSGHMMSSVSFYGFFIFLILNGDLLIPLKIMLSLGLSLIIFLIGYSRVFLGVHFGSDIVGAFFLGSSYLLFMGYLINMVNLI